MTSVTLTHAHHAESQRRALGQRRGRATPIVAARAPDLVAYGPCSGVQPSSRSA